jgi:hypothetical protein
MTDLISKDIVDLQDIEKIQYIQALQADPAKYASYIQGKSARILSETIDTKRASFVKTASDMARMMDMDHNSMATFIRSKQLSEAQNYIMTEQGKQTGVLKTNEDLTRRQVEINNWYYENKRETLFILQLILLTMLTVTVLLALLSYGFITKLASDYIIFFVIVVSLVTWLYRWYYTSYIRSRRYWNKRQFKEDRSIEPPKAECPTDQ